MPRKLLYRTTWNPYHVTARCNNKEPFPLPLSIMWKVLTSELLVLQLLYETEIHAFVLMPNHFHLLLTTPKEDMDLGKLMSVFLSNVTRRCNRISGKTGHLFGGPHHRTHIDSSRYFAHALKYVYRNPVRGGLCNKVEEYPFSTFQGLIGESALPFPIHYTRAGMERLFPSLEAKDWFLWLNTEFESEVEAKIRKGLRKRFFGPKKNPTARFQDLLFTTNPF